MKENLVRGHEILWGSRGFCMGLVFGAEILWGLRGFCTGLVCGAAILYGIAWILYGIGVGVARIAASGVDLDDPERLSRSLAPRIVVWGLDLDGLAR